MDNTTLIIENEQLRADIALYKSTNKMIVDDCNKLKKLVTKLKKEINYKNELIKFYETN